VIIDQGKQKEERRREKGRKRNERGLKTPIVVFLSSPNKNVRLWWLQTISFFFFLT
jgi:hypothetical protein